MKPLLLLCIAACFAALAFAQSAVNYGNVAIKAEHQEREGALIRCRGRVEIAAGNTLFRADEADFHSDTGEIELRGNVRVKLLASASKPYLTGESLELPRPDQEEIERRFRRSLSFPEIWQ
jgi:Organic solvent tolerance protein OstA